MQLLNKFLVTGANTVQPKPSVPYSSEEDAIRAAKRLIENAGNACNEAIIWKPFKVVKRKEVPIEVLDAAVAEQQQAAEELAEEHPE